MSHVPTRFEKWTPAALARGYQYGLTRAWLIRHGHPTDFHCPRMPACDVVPWLEGNEAGYMHGIGQELSKEILA